MHEDMFSEPVAIEGMWPFPMPYAPDSLIDALDMWMLPDELQKLATDGGMIELTQPYDIGRAGVEALIDEAYFNRLYGYVALATTPVFTPQGENSHSFSWAHQHLKLLWAETPEQIMEKALAWAQEMHNR